MPLFMDIHHHVEGLTADGVAKAHEADLKVQAKPPSPFIASRMALWPML